MARKMLGRMRSIHSEAFCSLCPSVGKGANLPMPLLFIRSHTVAVRADAPPELQVVLSAETALARVGLEQAALDAGLMVSVDGSHCVASIRTAGVGLPHPDIDICTDGSHVTVTFGNGPSAQLWLALGRLIHSLLPRAHTAESHS
jgi:hypothetical protein